MVGVGWEGEGKPSYVHVNPVWLSKASGAYDTHRATVHAQREALRFGCLILDTFGRKGRFHFIPETLKIH